MALEGMRDALYARLIAEKAPEGRLATWQALWDEAQKNPGKPLPCPVCFLSLNAISRLEPMPNDGTMAVAFCPACKETFKWPDEG